MESTTVVRDCNSCLHHVQGRGIDDAPARCWDCTRSNSLPLWEAHTWESPSKPLDEPKSALDTQVGGSHYKHLKIQPMEYSMANGLDACQHTAIKYVTRFRDKGGIQDLDKAIHAIELLKEFELKKEPTSGV